MFTPVSCQMAWEQEHMIQWTQISYLRLIRYWLNKLAGEKIHLMKTTMSTPAQYQLYGICPLPPWFKMFKCQVRYWWWERASYENHSVHTCLVSPVLPAGAGPVVLEHLRKKVFLSKSDNILIFPLAAENPSCVEIWQHEISPQCASSEQIIVVFHCPREGGWKDTKWSECKPIFDPIWALIECQSHVQINWQIADKGSLCNLSS